MYTVNSVQMSTRLYNMPNHTWLLPRMKMRIYTATAYLAPHRIVQSTPRIPYRCTAYQTIPDWYSGWLCEILRLRIYFTIPVTDKICPWCRMIMIMAGTTPAAVVEAGGGGKAEATWGRDPTRTEVEGVALPGTMKEIPRMMKKLTRRQWFP